MCNMTAKNRGGKKKNVFTEPHPTNRAFILMEVTVSLNLALIRQTMLGALCPGLDAMASRGH